MSQISQDASRAGEIADAELASVRFDTATTDGQPQTDAGSIAAPLLERPEQLFRLSPREATALVLDVDDDALLRRGPHRPASSVLRVEHLAGVGAGGADRLAASTHAR